MGTVASGCERVRMTRLCYAGQRACGKPRGSPLRGATLSKSLDPLLHRRIGDGGHVQLRSLEAITQAFDGAGVPFIVVGGLAVVAPGYGRQTQDLAGIAELNHLNGRDSNA